MNRITTLLPSLILLGACGSPDVGSGDEHAAGEAFERGAHNGRLLERDGFAVELAIYETGVPPEYRVWLYEDGKPLPPGAATVEVGIERLGGKQERFTFHPEGDYLRGSGVVSEPHSFDVGCQRDARRQGNRMEVRVVRRTHDDRVRNRTGDGAVNWRCGSCDSQRATDVVGCDPGGSRARVQGACALSGHRARRSPSSRGPALRAVRCCARIQSNESLQNYSIDCADRRRRSSSIARRSGRRPARRRCSRSSTCRASGSSSTCSRTIWPRSTEGQAGGGLRSGRSPARAAAGWRASRRSRFTAARASGRASSSTTPPARCDPGSSSPAASRWLKRRCRSRWRSPLCSASAISTWSSSRSATPTKCACSSSDGPTRRVSRCSKASMPARAT